MKKTKLLTSIAALALVLGLGACTTTEDETPTESESSTTSEETSEPTDTTPSTSTPEDDGGENSEGYTIIFTLYDGNSAVQTAPEYGSLYFEGAPTGSWNATGSYWEWGGFTALKETTDASGNVAYGATFDIETLNTGSDLEYMIVFTYEGEDPAWTPVKSGDNFKITIPDDITIGGVQYVDCTGCYTLTDQFGKKGASCTIAVKDTADSSSDRTLYCSGSMNSWNNSNAMTYNASGTDYQYSYTFDCSENQELTFGIFNDSNWNDSLQIGTDETGLCSNSGNNVVVSGNAIGSNTNTLIIFTVDGTNFGSTSTHVTTTAVSITH